MPGFEKRDYKIVEMEKRRNCPCSDRGRWKCFCQFDGWMGKLGITCSVGVMEKTALLGTARILRKVLEM